MLVKKYGNRRLYDTEDSRYVRLGELAEKIRQGAEVRVVDARTDADLTSETLAQIIFEDRQAARLLPPALLQQMIRMGDDALAEFLGRYLTWALDMYLQARSQSAAFSPFSGFGGFNPSAFAFPFARPPAPPAPSPAPPPARREAAAPASAPSARDGDVAELRRELEALKRSLRKRAR
jgi:polyhydroxyalkanoate synthesis repressor PhaR